MEGLKGTFFPQALWWQHEISLNCRIKSDLLLELVAYSFKTPFLSIDCYGELKAKQDCSTVFLSLWTLNTVLAPHDAKATFPGSSC